MKLLGRVLEVQGHHDSALVAYRKALELDPTLLEIYADIGWLLQGNPAAAQAAFRKITHAGPDAALGRLVLDDILSEKGIALDKPATVAKDLSGPAAVIARMRLVARGELGKPLPAYRALVKEMPELAALHAALGNSLWREGDNVSAKDNEALAAYLEMRRLAAEGKATLELKHPARTIRIGIDAGSWSKFAALLRRNGRAREADEAEARSLRSDPGLDSFHDYQRLDAVRHRAGAERLQHGQWEEAALLLRRTLRTKFADAETHTLLGQALFRQGKLDEAAATLREAIALDWRQRAAHQCLGRILTRQGKPAEADEAFRHAVTDVATAKGNRMRAMLDRLPAFLKGEFRPTTAAQRLGLCELLADQSLNFAAARLYAETFTAEPALADTYAESTNANPFGGVPAAMPNPFGNTHRYDAACCAALAGTGDADDGATLPPAERLHWRQQALAWLRTELAFRKAQVDSQDATARQAAQSQLRHWQTDADLLTVRAPANLAALAADERQAFTQFWSDVAALLNRVQEKPKQASK